MSEQYIREYPVMSNKWMAYSSIAAIALSSTVFGQDQDQGTFECDPVALKLQQDIATFKAGLETIRMPVYEALRKRRQEAQESGDLHKLEEATKDRDYLTSQRPLRTVASAIPPGSV